MKTPLLIPEKSEEPVVCFNESNTIVCGKIETFDYEKLEKNITFEPFFGEIDLFGF
jgi:hypothetical protein